MRLRLVPVALVSPLAFAAPSASAVPPGVEDIAVPRWSRGPLVLDMSQPAQVLAERYVADQTVEQPDFWSLDEVAEDAADLPAVPPGDAGGGALPDGWVQQGDVVFSPEQLERIANPDAPPLPGVEDLPGNKYPRKHTVFLNFNGGMLYVGADNSAENKSTLAKQGVYPTYTGGNTRALAAIEAFKADVAKYGIRVLYLERPNKTVPYTMVMIGGSWQDTNLGDPAGGVAPGTDCEALGQRHVVYTFASGAWGSLQIANVSAQEAGHAWGLDHSANCESVMAYCGGGDQSFSDTCDPLCEQACQGAAGCKPTHEKYCPPGQQNEDAELTYIFGTNEPDMVPPTVEIVSPAEGDTFDPGSNIELRATVDDDYGGVGWKITVEKDGEAVFDQVDYKKEWLDANYRVAINLSGVEPGTYVFRVTAEDHADHITVGEVTFSVGDGVGATGGGGDPGTGGGTGGGGETGAGDGTAGTGGIESGSGSGGEASSEEGGCSVAARPSGPVGPAGLLLLAGWVRIRRRI